MVVKMIIIGAVCFFVGLMLMAVVSIDRVNRERRGNTYE